MTAITTPRLKESTDSLLRFAMRTDAILSGIAGIAGILLAGWLAETSGTTKAFEYSIGAFFIAFAVGVFYLAAKPSVRRAGMMVAIGNALFTVACVVAVLADVFPLTTTGVVLFLGTGAYTAAIAELQYQGVRRIKA
ncbi:MAG TPA: hypothetical protein VMS92_18845 [Mycobacterium sp.]|jgi:hypothetical protein|nr:hypothetical protein [Mycobacterium sp.]